ncbi:hypothetical protein [Inquilinus sp.]
MDMSSSMMKTVGVPSALGGEGALVLGAKPIAGRGLRGICPDVA